MDTTGRLPGRRKFLEQRARLAACLEVKRANNTANRFNALGETQRKVLFMLANEISGRFPGLPQLTRSHLAHDFESLTDQEQQSLMLGIKRLTELAYSMPWEFNDYAAPRAEIQAMRDQPPAPDNTIS